MEVFLIAHEETLSGRARTLREGTAFLQNLNVFSTIELPPNRSRFKNRFHFGNPPQSTVKKIFARCFWVS